MCKQSDELVTLQTELEQSRKMISELQQSENLSGEANQKKQQELQENLREEFDQERNELLERLKNEREEHKKDVDILKASHENFQKDFASTSLSMQQLIEEKEKLIEQKKELAKENEQLTESLEKQVSALKDLQQNVDEQKTDASPADDSQSEKLCEITQKYELLAAEKIKLEERLQNEIVSLKSELTTKEETVFSSKQEIEILQSKFSSSAAELRKAKSLLDSEHNFKSDLQNEIDNLNFQINELRENENELQTMNESLKSRVLELETAPPPVKSATGKVSGNGKGNGNGRGNVSPRGNGGAGAKVVDPKKRVQTLTREKEILEQDLKKAVKTQEGLTYEISELQEEKEIMRNEMQLMKEQMDEWEHMMNMLQEDKNRMLHELDESDVREKKVLGDLDSLKDLLGIEKEKEEDKKDEINEEEDGNKEETDVFESSAGQEVVTQSFEKIKSVLEKIIGEKERFRIELDEMCARKGDSSIEIQAIKREMQVLQEERDSVEREKESVSVMLHLAEDKEHGLNEENTHLREAARQNEQEVSDLNQKLADAQGRVENLEKSQEDMLSKIQNAMEEKQVLVEKVKERQTYTEELENKILDMSNSLSEMKMKHEQFIAKIETEGESANSVLQMELNETKNNIAELEKDNESMRETADCNNKEKQVLEKRLSSVENERKNLEERISEIENEKAGILTEKEEICLKYSQQGDVSSKDKQELEDRLAGMASERETLQQRIQEVENENAKMLTEKEHICQKHAQLEEDFRLLNEQNNKLNEKCEETQKTYDSVSKEMKLKDDRITLLEDGHSNLTQEVEACKATIGVELGNLKEECERWKKQCEELKNQNEVYVSQISEYSEKVAELQKSLSERDGNEARLGKDLEGLRVEISVKTEENAQLKSALEATDSEFESARADVRSQKEAFVVQQEKLEIELSDIKGVVENLQRDLSEKENVIMEKEREHQVVNAEFENSKLKCLELERQLQILQEQSETSVNAVIEKLKEELNEKDRLHQELCNKIQSFTSENVELKTLTENLQKLMESSKEEKELAENAEFNHLREEIAKKDKLNQEADDRLKTADDRLKKLCSEIESFKSANEKLTEKLQSLTKELVSVKEQVSVGKGIEERLTEEKQTLETMLNELESKLSSSEAKLAEVVAKNEELTVQMKDIRNNEEEIQQKSQVSYENQQVCY